MNFNLVAIVFLPAMQALAIQAATANNPSQYTGDESLSTNGVKAGKGHHWGGWGGWRHHGWW
jgi:hypothetical protein